MGNGAWPAGVALAVPAVPLLAAAVGMALPVLTRHRPARGWCAAYAVAVAAPGGALVLAVIAAAGRAGGITTQAFLGTPAASTASARPAVGALLDGPAAATGLLVAAIALLVQVYAGATMRADPRYGAHAALTSLFTAAMLAVVYSADLLVLVVGWEVMGICSFLLIGHERDRPRARAAAVKAFVMTKAGDVPFLLGVLLLGTGAGSFRIDTVLHAATTPGALPHRGLAALLLLGGVVGKSAQFPLHGWLPDAMAAPTPVSALLHAATMVAAGVYVVVRLFPLFLTVPAALAVLGVVAAVTTVGAALGALTADDVKRVLAWSTISQLGVMYAALAVGARDAALFQLAVHAVAKALLFLAAGVLATAAGTSSVAGWGSSARVRGLRDSMPGVLAVWTVGLAALAGVPPLGGFFAKDAVLTAAWHAAADTPAGPTPRWAAVLVLVAVLAVAALTAAYSTRLLLRALAIPAGAPAPGGAGAPGPADVPDPATRSVPAAVLVPLWTLASACLALAAVGLAGTGVPTWLGGPAESLAPELLPSLVGLALAAVGVAAVGVAAVWLDVPARVLSGWMWLCTAHSGTKPHPSGKTAPLLAAVTCPLRRVPALLARVDVLVLSGRGRLPVYGGLLAGAAVLVLGVVVTR